MPSVQRFNYVNCSDRDFRVTLEPWADQYLICSGDSIEIEIHAQNELGILEIEQTSMGLVIYAYEGSIVCVMRNGVELPPSDQV